MKTGDSSSRSTAPALSSTPAVPPLRNDSSKLARGTSPVGRERRLQTILLATLLSTPALHAQTEMPRIDAIVEVRVASIDVVVTDAKGKHVKGLTRDDFEVIEDGKAKEITGLSEYGDTSPTDASAPTEPPPLRMVVFFDAFSTSTFERKRAASAISRLIDALRPQDSMMIVSWNRRMTIVSPSTADRQRLTAGLDRAVREVSLGSGSPIWWSQGAASSDGESIIPIGGGPAYSQNQTARRIQNRVQARVVANDLKQSVAALAAVLSPFAGTDGRKVLLLVTRGFSMRPGVELLDPDEAEDLLETENIDGPKLIETVARMANVAGVAVYGIHAAGLESGMSVEDTTFDIGEGRARSTASSLDSLNLLAATTGGRVAARTNDFTRDIEALTRDLSTYYSLGYRIDAHRVDRERAITVRTRNPAYIVRARRAFIERSFETEVADQVSANLFFPLAPNPLAVTATIGNPRPRKKNHVVVPVDVSIPYSGLSFVRRGKDLAADISLFISSADAKGETSGVQRFQRTVRVKPEELARITGKSFRYGLDLEVISPPGETKISIGVLDHLSKLSGHATVTMVMK